MFPRVLLGGLALIFTWCSHPLVYGVELAGLLEDPTFSMGMISRFTRGTMDLTYLVQNFVEAGQFIPGAFSGRLLTWLGAFESGIYCCIFSIVTINAAFVLVATRPTIVVLGIRTTRVFGQVVTAS